MSKYCHDDSIHTCLIECEGCSAYYDDKESENYLITEKDQRNFIENEIRADERRKFAEWLQENVFIDAENGVTVVAEVEYTRVISFIELLEMYERGRNNA